MDRMVSAAFVYFLVCSALVVCKDRSEDCDGFQLGIADTKRVELHAFLLGQIAVFQPSNEAMTTVCEIYASWESEMEPLYENCQHYAYQPGFNNENYTRTVAVYDLICGDKGKYDTHRPCLGDVTVQTELKACYDTFWTKYQKEITGVNPAPMSAIHDRGCDYLDAAIKCMRNVSAASELCSEADVDYYEDYFRAYIKPWMNVWNCQFDRSWGWIITTGILVALLAVLAVLWAALFLCCRYCCGCLGGGGGRERRDSDDERHPMERY